MESQIEETDIHYVPSYCLSNHREESQTQGLMNLPQKLLATANLGMEGCFLFFVFFSKDI